MYQVSSEIYKETNFETVKRCDGKAISKFKFHYPSDEDADESDQLPTSGVTTDKDGDLVVRRKRPSANVGVIEIAHSEATELRLVGLQVWRGALLLADFIFHCRAEFRDKCLLELGAGVGLTSIAAAIYARRVVCTDVDIGGILNMIRDNFDHNSKLFANANFDVIEYDFLCPVEEYSAALLRIIDESDIVLAADVIYDDELTEAFIRVIDTVFNRGTVSGKEKTIYVALEKRFVFTLSELDAVAPMYEHFLKQTLHKPWKIEYIPIDFPQYFEYERCKQLVLFKVTRGRVSEPSKRHK